MNSVMMASQSTTSHAMIGSTQRSCPFRAAPQSSRKCTLRTVAAAKQDNGTETAAPRLQRALQAGAHVLVSVAATQMALLPLSGAALALSQDDANMGPNEVTKEYLGTGFQNSDNPFDTAMPGRTGETFGKGTPGNNDTGAVDVSAATQKAEEGAAQASSIFDKIKDALPFGTLPTFDLADLSADDANMGPNEVTKEYLGTGFQNSNNPFDTAMPGRSGETFGADTPGQNDAGAVDIGAAANKAAEQAAEGNKIFEKIKEALPFGTLPVFDLAELSADDANMGPNEVTKEYLATGFQNSNNPFDTAMPGRTGETFGADKPGENDPGAVDVGAAAQKAAEQAAEGNKIFEKIKEALPFGTLPVFDLAEVSKDDANMGPNEVNQELLATGFQNSDNPFDTAMPGRTGETFGANKPGENDAGAVDIGAAAEKAGEKVADGSKVTDQMKGAIPFGLLPVFDLAELSADDANMGPNEVTKEYLGSGFQNSNNPFDTAMPGRTGETFGANTPGENDAGAVDVAKAAEKADENAAKASNFIQKIKDALPFGTMPLFDVSANKQTADLGPNEVTQKVLGDLPNANKFDQAAPGRAGTVGKKAGQSVGNAAKDSVADAKSKVDSAATKTKKFFGLF